MSDSKQTPEFEMEFPQRFAVKAMGEAGKDFESHVTALILRTAEQDVPLAVAARESKNGKFTSVTVDITATSRQQLDNIYQALTDDDRVLMAL